MTTFWAPVEYQFTASALFKVNKFQPIRNQTCWGLWIRTSVILNIHTKITVLNKSVDNNLVSEWRIEEKKNGIKTSHGWEATNFIGNWASNILQEGSGDILAPLEQIFFKPKQNGIHMYFITSFIPDHASRCVTSLPWRIPPWVSMFASMLTLNLACRKDFSSCKDVGDWLNLAWLQYIKEALCRQY